MSSEKNKKIVVQKCTFASCTEKISFPTQKKSCLGVKGLVFCSKNIFNQKIKFLAISYLNLITLTSDLNRKMVLKIET